VWRETLRERLDWKYDSAADVLYVSVGKPRKAIGIDIGQGVVVRYDEAKGEVVGLKLSSGMPATALPFSAPPTR
jgi:uncharacterized protein YuzE